MDIKDYEASADGTRPLGVLLTANRLVAVEPLPVISNEIKVTKGLAMLSNKIKLIPLRVIFCSGALHPGMTVYIREDTATVSDLKRVYQIGTGGPEFVLLPEDRIVLVDLEIPKGEQRTPAIPFTQWTLKTVPGPGETVPYFPSLYPLLPTLTPLPALGPPPTLIPIPPAGPVWGPVASAT